ncbi:MAG TPA: hypothetical protein VFQ61_16840 [Polyangiaceae bacterium]|nr:hypothetical protein [Polyangiaceae bacterium]
MLTRRSLLWVWASGMVGLFTSSAAERARAAERTRLAVVVAKSSRVEGLSLAQLRRAFLGDPLELAGKNVNPVNRANGTKERTGFDSIVLGMSPEEVPRYWIDRKIRGQSGAPKAVEPSELHQRVVAKVDGGIGYVIPSEVRDDVKVVRVDGKLPNEKGYPIEF